jgi:hypothetical protein
MHDPNTRRGFLRGLASLPLIGGGVTLIGNPTRAAEPVTLDLLDAYNERLFMERRMLCIEQWGRVSGVDAESVVPANTGAHEFTSPRIRLAAGRVCPSHPPARPWF